MTNENERFSFPECMVNVTAGQGGESLMILGNDRTALYDTGMAYCGEQLVENIREALGKRRLDYVILSHSHYDHIGALPNVVSAFPEAVVAGGAYCAHVFTREGAKRTMVRMGKAAAEKYGGDPDSISADGMEIDLILHEGDTIDLGGRTLTAYEAPGHTKCSMAYMMEPEHILFTSETSCVLHIDGSMEPAILKSYDAAVSTIEKCRKLHPKRLICPHYGMVPDELADGFWDRAEKTVTEERNFILSMLDEDLTMDQMLGKYKEKYYVDERKDEQPLEALLENAGATISLYAKEAGKDLRQS